MQVRLELFVRQECEEFLWLFCKETHQQISDVSEDLRFVHFHTDHHAVENRRGGAAPVPPKEQIVLLSRKDGYGSMQISGAEPFALTMGLPLKGYIYVTPL